MDKDESHTRVHPQTPWWQESSAIPVILAPMAGVTDSPYRIICSEYGADATVTEMISVDGLVRDNPNTWEMLRGVSGEKHCAVQLFGQAPDLFSEAASKLSRSGLAPVAFDVNMGCPVPKVVKRGAGAALMLDVDAAAAVVQSLVEGARSFGISVPVWVKIRSGWDPETVNAPEFARQMVQAGASGVTVHARTRSAYYSGRADWEVISRVVAAVDVPVIGNGDVFSAEDAVKMVRRTQCAGVMVGRGAMGAPWIFREIAAALAGRKTPAPPAPKDRVDVLLRHLFMEVEFRGTVRAARFMRKHVHWYTSGLPHSAALRDRANGCETGEQLRGLLEEYRDHLSG
ncbi:MAG: tRNA dihydrouridine synthase DusB [Bacillota bacterium]